MTTEAAIGHGSKFQTGNGDGPPETFTDFAEVTSITPPAFARDSVDASHHLSPDQFRDYIPGMTDAGEITIEFNFLAANAATAALIAEFSLAGAAAIKNRRIVFPDGTYWEFSGFATGSSSEDPFDDKMSASATFKITGKPTLTTP